MNQPQKIQSTAAAARVASRSDARLRAFALFSTGLALGLLAALPVHAATGTWIGAGDDGLWTNLNNWDAGLIPGSNSALNNPDVALFNSNPTQTIITIDPTRYVRSITFDGSAGAFTIGGLGADLGEPIYLTHSGTLQIAAGLFGSGITETVNAPIIIQSATATSACNYTVANNSIDPTNVLKIAGSISTSTTSGAGTFTLNGSNTGDNVISGSLNGTTTNTFGIVKAGTGTWTIAGSVVTKGTAQNGGLNVSAGTLNLAATSSVNIAGKVVITTGATLNSAGIAALGTNNGGTPGDYITIGDGSNGTLNVTDGVLTVTPATGKAFVIGTLDAPGTDSGTVNVSGGILQITNTAVIRFGAWDGTTARHGTGFLNLSGTGLFDTGTTTGNMTLGAGSASSSGTINLDGGTLQTRRNITKGPGAATINFNGGTIRATSTNTTFIAAGVISNVKAGGAIIDTNGFNLAIASAFQEDPLSTGGGLTKNGNGTLTLNGASTYTGPTTINGGTLVLSVSGSIAGSTQIKVASGATFDVSSAGVFRMNGVLSGGGTVKGDIAINSGGTLTPGDGPGTLDINGMLNFNAGSTLALELTGSTSGDGVGFYDQVNMTNPSASVSIDGDAHIVLSLSAFTPQATDTFFVLTRADSGSFFSFFSGAGEGATVDLGNGYSGTITYMADSGTGLLTGGNDIAIFNVVPEPGTSAALLAANGTLLGLLRLRRPRFSSKGRGVSL